MKVREVVREVEKEQSEEWGHAEGARSTGT